MSGIGAISRAQVHVGTPALRSAFDDVLGRAKTSAHVDLFRAGDEAVMDQLAALAKRDVSLAVLADTDAATGHAVRDLRRTVADEHWHEFGADPFKQHGKSLSRDAGTEALVATDVADEDSAHRIELAATFVGAPARALAAVHAASGGSRTQMRRALAAAAEVGVVGNDPHVGAEHVTDAIRLLIDAPSPYLNVMTKSFDSPRLVEQLKSVAKTGARDVTLLTHDLPRSQQQTLARAGVDVRLVDEAEAERIASALHGTLIDTGDRALVTSAYLDDRVLKGSRGRRSRELGVVLGGDAAAQAHAAWQQLLTAMP